MTRGKREQRSSEINHLSPFHHVHAHYAAPSTTLVLGTHCSLSNCDHAASQLLQTISMMASFTAAKVLKLYCLFMKAGLLDKTGEPSVCFLVACRFVHYRYSSCSTLTRGSTIVGTRLVRVFPKPKESSEDATSLIFFFRGYFRCSKGGFWPVC